MKIDGVLQELDKADHCVRKTKFLQQPSKKKDCPAKIHIRHIVKFPEYKVHFA